MRLLGPLPIGAFLLALTALIWSVHLFTVIVFPLALLTGLAGSIVLLFAKPTDRPTRLLLQGTAAGILVLHVAFFVLFVMATSVNIGQNPEQGFNLHPPEWAIAALGYTLLPFAGLLSAGVYTTMFKAWGRIERLIGATGVLLVLIAVALQPFPEAGEPARFIQQALFMIGFLGLATALILAPFVNAGPPWTRAHTRPTADATDA